MKTFLIGIVPFFFALNAFGQSDNGFTNKAEAKNLILNGLKEGKWVEGSGYDFNISGNDSTPCSASFKLTVYKAGKPFGIQREYAQCNGKLMLVIPYSNGKQNGITKGYFDNGELSFESTYVDGKPIGVTKWYYRNGHIQTQISYNNDGKANGVKKEYYESGKLKSETTYTNGVEGATKYYNENGDEIK